MKALFSVNLSYYYTTLLYSKRKKLLNIISANASELSKCRNGSFKTAFGIDQGAGSTYYKSFIPPIGMVDGYESIIYFPNEEERNITIYFPLYNAVNDLYIGLQNSASIGSGAEYRMKKPVLYYGSSITQGGCASRPGNSYQSIISRRLDCDHINLGFSGCARAEDVIIDYMSDLDVSVFVCDYDHNSPDVDHLKATHEKVYKKFRDKSSQLPVIMISRPDFDANPNTTTIFRSSTGH